MSDHTIPFLHIDVPVHVRTGIVTNMQQRTETHVSSSRDGNNRVSSVSSTSINVREYSLISDDGKETPHWLRGIDLFMADGHRLSLFYSGNEISGDKLIRVFNHNTDSSVDIYANSQFKKAITEWNYPGVYSYLSQAATGLFFTITAITLLLCILRPSTFSQDFPETAWYWRALIGLISGGLTGLFGFMIIYSIRDILIWWKRRPFTHGLDLLASSLKDQHA